MEAGPKGGNHAVSITIASLNTKDFKTLPRLMLGITFGVTIDAVFSFWLIITLIIILFTERYENEMTERSQSASNANQPPPDPTQVYLELVDKTKNQVFGLGSESRLYIPGRHYFYGSGSSSNEMQRQMEHLQQRNTLPEQLVLQQQQLFVQQQKILDNLQRIVHRLSRSAGPGTTDDGIENEQENHDDQDEHENENLG